MRWCRGDRWVGSRRRCREGCMCLLILLILLRALLRSRSRGMLLLRPETSRGTGPTAYNRRGDRPQTVHALTGARPWNWSRARASVRARLLRTWLDGDWRGVILLLLVLAGLVLGVRLLLWLLNVLLGVMHSERASCARHRHAVGARTRSARSSSRGSGPRTVRPRELVLRPLLLLHTHGYMGVEVRGAHHSMGAARSSGSRSG